MSGRFPLLVLVMLIHVVAHASAQNGPGGVGNITGTSSLLLWLRSDQIAGKSDGDTIALWKDLSGHGNNATQSTASLRPTYETDAGNAINGKPVVRFYNDNVYLANSAFSHSGDFTIYAVYRTPTARVSDWSKRVFSAPGASQADDAGGIAMLEYAAGGISAKANYASFSSKSISRYCISKQMNTDGTTVDGLHEFDGNIAELIVYNENLPYVRRMLVENALNARYGVSITEDYYASTTYTTDVAGIGRALSTNYDSASSGGLILRDNGTLDQDGDYFLAGHTAAQNSVVTTDLPAGAGGRWSRDWFIDETGYLGGKSIKVEFDFSDGGIAGTPDDTSHFVLLARTGTSGTYNIVSAGNRSISGDRVVFTLSDAVITDRYYTLGITDVADTNHAEHLSITGPGGIGTVDGTSSLALWFRADAITGMNDGEPLSIWFDQSGNWHNAVQPYLSLSPIYRNNATSNINGFPVVDFNADNAVLRHNTFARSGLFTVLAVYDIPSVRTTNPGKRIFSAPSSTQQDIPGGLYLYESSSGAVAPKLVNSQFTSSRSITGFAIGKEMLPDGTIVEGNNEFDGNVAEVIVFNEDLPYEKRVIVENYLAAKYHVTPVQSMYAEQNYKYDVAGIGRSTSAVTTSRSAGMVLSDSGALDASGKYFLFGHNNAETGSTRTNLPTGVTDRWLREWYIDQTGYLSGKRMSIAFDFDDAGHAVTPGNALNYRLLRRGSPSSTFAPVATLSTRVVGDQIIFEVYDVNITDGYYTLGATTHDTPLPVQLVSFGARPSDRGVSLFWTTASEQDNRGFRLSRSESATGEFQVIADYATSPSLSGQGRSEVEHDYGYLDEDRIEPGASVTYRLQSIDLDGTVREGMTTTLMIPANSGSIPEITSVGRGTPNPFRASTEITIEATKQDIATVALIDAHGEEIRRETMDVAPGVNRYVVDGAGLPAGVYWLRFRIGTRAYQRAVVHLE